MNVFISLPMRDRPDDLIRKQMDEIMGYIRHKYEPVETKLIDTVVHCPLDKHPSVACLGRSISLMADADLVVFAPGWNKARGCQIEYEVAVEYHIPLMFLSSQTDGTYVEAPNTITKED